MPPAYSVLRGGSAGDGNGTSNFPPYTLDKCYDYDDFIDGGDTVPTGSPLTVDLSRNGSIGRGWTQIESLGLNGYTWLGVADTESEQADHPGILYLTAQNDGVDSMVRISKPISVGNPATSNSVIGSVAKTFHWRAIVNAYQIQVGMGGANTSLNQMFGLANNNITAIDPSGVGFCYRRSAGTPHTTWHAFTGSPTSDGDNTDTGVTVDTTYHLFEITHVGGTNTYVFKIDGTIVHTATFDFEGDLGTQLLIPFFSLLEDSAGDSEKYLAIDYYDFLTSGLDRGESGVSAPTSSRRYNDDLTSQINGATDTFTLPAAAASVPNAAVYHNSLRLRPSDITSISGTTLQLAFVPAGGSPPTDTLTIDYDT